MSLHKGWGGEGAASHGACSGSGAINIKASSAPASLPTMQLFPKEPTAVMSLMLQLTEVVKQVRAEEGGLVTGNTHTHSG